MACRSAAPSACLLVRPPLQMLTNIEIRLEDHLAAAEQLPADVVEAAEKAREKERRQTARCAMELSVWPHPPRVCCVQTTGITGARRAAPWARLCASRAFVVCDAVRGRRQADGGRHCRYPRAGRPSCSRSRRSTRRACSGRWSAQRRRCSKRRVLTLPFANSAMEQGNGMVSWVGVVVLQHASAKGRCL